jgi:exosortase family protein XrtF
MKIEWKPYQGVILFLGKVLLLYFGWNLLYAHVMEGSSFSHLVTTILTKTSVALLSVAGFALAYNCDNMCVIAFQENSTVFIGEPCNAVDFFGLFTCFVIAYPARFWSKVWFIPAGILAIHALNTVRVALLVLNLWYSRESFDFNHKYTFILFLYGLIFLLWRSWTKRFGSLKV